jgi:hypothetical protein
LTIAGFMKSDFAYWNKPVLRELSLLSNLNGVSFEQLETNVEFRDYFRRFINAPVRATKISNYKTDDVLYSIFHRINKSSVSLSPQELRQALHKGPFSDFLVEKTSSLEPIHSVLGLDEPDKRMVDAEILLRLISFDLFGSEYRGNLKKFLDDHMGKVNKEWVHYEPVVENLYRQINAAIELLNSIFSGEGDVVGRRFTSGKWEARFNKSLFEVELFFFLRLVRIGVKITAPMKKNFLELFMELSQSNEEFIKSIVSSTKDSGAYYIRFSLFQSVVNKSFRLKLNEVPFTTTKA